MKTTQHFSILYILLAIAQVVICNYFRISPYITLSILPAMVLCIPLHKSTVSAMVIAFATGLAADALSEGVLGLNTLALVPVALMRKTVIMITMGRQALEKDEPFSIRYEGLGKVSLAIIMVQAVFLAIYITADGAGTRPFWFNATRFGASLASSYLLSLLAVHILNSEDRK